MTPDLAPSEIQSEFSSLLGSSSNSRLSLIKLAGDISTRSYYRITSRAGVFILQQAEPFKDEKDHSFLLAQKIFASCGVRVPKIFDLRPQKGWIVMEDLGDEMLQTHIEKKFYRKSIDALVAWTHLAHPLNPSFEYQDALHFRQFFDIEKFNFEMNHTDSHLFQKLLKKSPGTFFETVRHNSTYLNARPKFLCHRDYHSRNIMIRNDEAIVIDFQDARMGPVSYDLVSLLWDPYARLENNFRTDLFEYWKESLLKLISKGLVGALLKEVFEDFDQELHRMKIQRLLKAAGSYASFYNQRGRDDYLHCIPFAVKESIVSLDWLDQNKKSTAEDRALRELLEGHSFTALGKS